LKAAKVKLDNDFDFSIFTNLPVDKIEEEVEEENGEV